MTSTTPRIILTSLATLALVAPAANAMPLRDHDGVQTSSRAGTTSAPHQDLRNPDNQGPRYQTPGRVAPIPVQQSPYTADQLKPLSTPAQVTADDDPSPFVYIIPGVVLIAMLGAGIAFARTSRVARRSHACQPEPLPLFDRSAAARCDPRGSSGRRARRGPRDVVLAGRRRQRPLAHRRPARGDRGARPATPARRPLAVCASPAARSSSTPCRGG
jgi:hypothetical protein